MDDVVTCERCGAVNPAGARFCNGCGASLTAAGATEERKLVSVLFVDLVDFTARSDRADPEDVRDVLRLYHAGAKEQIERYGGVVEKFIGDAVMAVFGMVSHGDDAERAVRAGFQVLAGIDELNRRQPGLELAARAAVNTGEAVVAVGDRAAGDALAMGDVVNTAARLQSAAPTGGVVVGAETYRATRHAVRYEQLPAVDAKGKERPVEAWLAVEPLAEAAEPAATVTPIVGRDRELELLDSTWERAAEERRPHAVTVLGAPGIGKSRLARELAARVRQRGGRVLRGRCLPYDEQAGYPAFGQIVREIAGVYESDPALEARAKLDRTTAALLPDEEPTAVARYLSLILGLGTDEPADQQVFLFYAARRLVERLGHEQPTLLVFEDVHWADDSQLDLFEYLATHVHDTGVLLLALARPELVDMRPAWGGGLQGRTTIVLEPLAAAHAEAVAGHALADAGQTAVVARLVELAEGNPLFLEELAAAFIERREGDELPVTVKAAIASRIDALPPREREILLAAAVVGKTFWRGILGSLAGTDGLDDGLTALEARDFVRREPSSQVEGDIEYSFRHGLILEVAYATLPRATRRERHAAVARYVEDATELRAESLAWVLAHHWHQAGEPARAVPYLLAAAERARDGWAREGVVELYSRALELTEDDGERVRIRLLRGFALVELQDYLRAAEELGELLPQLDGRDEVEALLARGRATLWTEQDEETLAMAERALELARGLVSEELVAAALALLAQGHGMRGAEGDIDRALELGDEALAAWVPGTRQDDLAQHLHLHSDVHYWTGRYEEAIDLGRRSKEAGGVSHSAEMLMRGAGMAGLALTAAGRHEEAIEMFDASMAQARELDRYVGTLLNYSSMAYRELHELAEARLRSEEALAMNPGWAGFGMPRMMARVDLLFTTMLEGDLGAAQAAWPALWADTAETAGWQSWLLVGKLAAARAELELAVGTPGAAAEWAQKAIDVAVRTHRRKYEARARSTLGGALAALGRHEDAERELRAAVELADALGSPPGRWVARESLGRTLAATASDDGAGAFDEAAAIVREFASTLAAERAERFLDAEPIRDLLRAAV